MVSFKSIITLRVKTMRVKRWRIHCIVAITLRLDNVDIVWLFFEIELRDHVPRIF